MNERHLIQEREDIWQFGNVWQNVVQEIVKATKILIVNVVFNVVTQQAVASTIKIF